VTKIFCIARTSYSPLVPAAAAHTTEVSIMIFLVFLTTMIKGVEGQHMTLPTHPCSVFVSSLFISFLSEFLILQRLWRPPSLRLVSTGNSFCELRRPWPPASHSPSSNIDFKSHKRHKSIPHTPSRRAEGQTLHCLPF